MIQARMKHPAMIVPDVMQHLQVLGQAAEQCGVPAKTIGLVQLRASRMQRVRGHARAIHEEKRRDG
jgi:hypothetical protein